MEKGMHIFCPPLYWFCNGLAIVWKYICSALQMWKTYIHIRGSIKHPHIVCVMSTNQTHLYFWHQIHYILIMICLVPSFPLIGHVLFWIFHDITSIMTTRGQRWSSSLDQPCRPMHLDEALLIENTRWFSWAAFFLRSSTLSISELILSPPFGSRPALHWPPVRTVDTEEVGCRSTERAQIAQAPAIGAHLAELGSTHGANLHLLGMQLSSFETSSWSQLSSLTSNLSPQKCSTSLRFEYWWS